MIYNEKSHELTDLSCSCTKSTNCWLDMQSLQTFDIVNNRSKIRKTYVPQRKVTCKLRLTIHVVTEKFVSTVCIGGVIWNIYGESKP